MAFKPSMSNSIFAVVLVTLISLSSDFSSVSLAYGGLEKLSSALSSSSSKTPFFIFGDSILDAGNNNYINTTTSNQANFYPYGITYFHYPTGRFSDGRLIADFIAQRVNLQLIHPFLEPDIYDYYDGVNFASGGSGALVTTYPGLNLNLHIQLENYKKVDKWLRNKLGEDEGRERVEKAVYLFSVGNNDYMSLFSSSNPFLTDYTPSQYVEMVIGNLTSVISEIHNTGGRKFAFINLPPLECVPGRRALNFNETGTDGCLKALSTYTKLHNKALIHRMEQMAKKLSGFKYTIYDFHTGLLQRINNPTLYGFKEGKVACCGSGIFRGLFSCGGKRGIKEYELCDNIEEHVFWDSIHMTENSYSQIAEEMWNNVNNALHSPNTYSIKDPFNLSPLKAQI